MFAPAPASPPASCAFDGTDEECMLYLVRRKNGSPLPANVTTDVNPFSIEPWKAPEKMWFFCNSLSLDCGRGKTRDVGVGYWKATENDIKLSTGSLTEGSKITWEFYMGVAPAGYKTGWTMLEYKRGNNKEHEDNIQQDFSSLCSVYRCDINSPFSKEEHNISVADDVEANYLQSILLNMAEDEEENNHLPESSNGSEVGHRDEQRQLPISTRKHELGPVNSTELLLPYSISEGDFVELKDFDDWESSSSSSDDSSCASRTSNEYFDSEALLQTLQNPSNEIIGESDADSKHSIHGNVVSDQVDKDVRPLGPAASSSVSALPSNGKTSSSHKGKGHRAKRAASLSPQNSGSSQGSGTPVSRRIAKLGKKYCCFGPV